LRVRCSACELHCRQRSRGKQYEAKSCHDGRDPGKSATSSGDQRIRLGRIVAASESGLVLF
jgi:hypothetical protein